MKLLLLLITALLFFQTGKCQNPGMVMPAFELLAKYPNIRDFTLSSSGEEGYFSLQSPLGEISVISMIRYENNRWQEPEIVSFSGNYKDTEPFLSPDGLKLYFASNRPLNDSVKEAKDYDIWVVERKDRHQKWGAPMNLGKPVNTEYNEFYPSVTLKNNLYFTCDAPGTKGKDDIFFCRWTNNRYEPPVSLSESVNTDGFEFNSYVSPDESFIIFSGYNRTDGFGSGDLYISFSDGNQNWCKAANLGEQINSKSLDYCPFVDLKTNTLYFTSKRSSIAEVNDFQSITEVVSEIEKYENGFSRIYKVAFKETFSRLKNVAP